MECLVCKSKLKYTIKFCSKKCYGISKKGVKQSPEHKDKIRKANIGVSRNLGYRHSEEAKIKIGLASKGNKYASGKKQSEETLQKRSLSMKKFYDLKGRKEQKRYKHSANTKQYRDWRKSIFERDRYTCQMCLIVGCYLEAHHIKSWAKFPELRYEIDNGMTVCRECHKLTDNYKGRGKKNA